MNHVGSRAIVRADSAIGCTGMIRAAARDSISTLLIVAAALRAGGGGF